MAASLSTIIVQSQALQVEPWQIELKSFKLATPKGPILFWKVEPAYLHDVERSSATELNDRLACPTKWVFNYLARLRSSPIASLPDSFLLKGTFCHEVLAKAFGAGGEPPRVHEAQQAVEEVFNDSLPRNAGPLAQPNALVEKERLSRQLRAATRLLVEALRAGSYQITAMEKEVSGKVGDRDLTGFVDCLARRQNGEELILDFKYGGRNKYRELLTTGRAVQLATYSAARAQEQGVFPAVAYLILADGVLYSPEGSAVFGGGPAEVLRDSPCIETIWTGFGKALAEADEWLKGTEPIPTRPLLDPENWPAGVELVLERPKASGENPKQDVCKYCDYKVLCGLRRLF
jgi:RecB family exonuclease